MQEGGWKIKKIIKQSKKKKGSKNKTVFIMIFMHNLQGWFPRQLTEGNEHRDLLILHAGNRFLAGPSQRWLCVSDTSPDSSAGSLSSSRAAKITPLPPPSFVAQEREEDNSSGVLQCGESEGQAGRRTAVMLTRGEKSIANALFFFSLIFFLLCPMASLGCEHLMTQWVYSLRNQSWMTPRFEVTSKSGKLNLTAKVYCPHELRAV